MDEDVQSCLNYYQNSKYTSIAQYAQNLINLQQFRPALKQTFAEEIDFNLEFLDEFVQLNGGDNYDPHKANMGQLTNKPEKEAAIILEHRQPDKIISAQGNKKVNVTEEKLKMDTQLNKMWGEDGLTQDFQENKMNTYKDSRITANSATNYAKNLPDNAIKKRFETLDYKTQQEKVLEEKKKKAQNLFGEVIEEEKKPTTQVTYDQIKAKKQQQEDLLGGGVQTNQAKIPALLKKKKGHVPPQNQNIQQEQQVQFKPYNCEVDNFEDEWEQLAIEERFEAKTKVFNETSLKILLNELNVKFLAKFNQEVIASGQTSSSKILLHFELNSNGNLITELKSNNKQNLEFIKQKVKRFV